MTALHEYMDMIVYSRYVCALQRAAAYMVANFVALSVLWLYFTGSTSVQNSISTASFSCIFKQKVYCGRSLHYDWYGINVECLNNIQHDGIVEFCDPERRVSRFLVISMITQIVSVIFWAVVWIVMDLTCLRLPLSRCHKENISAVQKHSNEGEEPMQSLAGNRSRSWSSKISVYHRKRNARRRLDKAFTLRKIIKSVNVFIQYVLFSFFSMGLSCLIWGHSNYTIKTKFITSKSITILMQMMSDPNITAKIASAMKNLNGPKLNKEDCYEFDKLRDHENSSKSWNFSSCLFIACHLLTSTSEEAKQLEATLRAALVHFPANHIFVCDNANVYSPPDKTESLVKKIHPEINYLYIPIGNKSFAFYWTEKYWLSHLQMNGIVSMSAGKYIVTIDDDVCLPNNFFVPTDHLDVNHEIAAVQYQVTPVSSSSQRGKRPPLTGFQYLEYIALSNIPEVKSPMPYKLSNSWEWFMWCPPLYCSGALGVWRREDFNRIMSKHDSYFQ